jgi:hypothetical protein
MKHDSYILILKHVIYNLQHSTTGTQEEPPPPAPPVLVHRGGYRDAAVLVHPPAPKMSLMDWVLIRMVVLVRRTLPVFPMLCLRPTKMTAGT